MRSALAITFLLIAFAIRAQEVYKYHGDPEKFFPDKLSQTPPDSSNRLSYISFHASSFSTPLRMLKEPSLSSQFQGKRTIRLSYFQAYADSHQVVGIEEAATGAKVYLKESIRFHKHITSDTVKETITYEKVEYDTLLNRTYRVRYQERAAAHPDGHSLTVISKKSENPIKKVRTKKLSTAQWSKLIKLVDETQFTSMASLTPAFHQDGWYILIEYNVPNGYYLVCRWVPEDPDFVRLTTEILSLAGIKYDPD